MVRLRRRYSSTPKLGVLIDAESLQAAYNLYERTLTDFFLKVNPTKTKTQICNFQKTPNFSKKSEKTPETPYPESLISAMSGTELVNIENVEEFCYVGALGIEANRVPDGPK